MIPRCLLQSSNVYCFELNAIYAVSLKIENSLAHYLLKMFIYRVWCWVCANAFDCINAVYFISAPTIGGLTTKIMFMQKINRILQMNELISDLIIDETLTFFHIQSNYWMKICFSQKCIIFGTKQIIRCLHPWIILCWQKYNENNIVAVMHSQRKNTTMKEWIQAKKYNKYCKIRLLYLKYDTINTAVVFGTLIPSLFIYNCPYFFWC